MAGTVVSMARSMLSGAISKAASAAADELSLVMGVRNDVWFIKDELKTMQAFLAAAEATKNKDMMLKVWAEQVRDLSYNIEDCLDEFMVHVRSQSRTKRLMKLKDRRRIAIEIRSLKSRVEEVSSRNTRYNLIKTEASNTTDEMGSYTEDVRNHSASNIDEAELVGFSKPREELIKLLDVSTEDGPAKVICIVGMGGLGKTTLARKTYENKEDIVKNYSCHAWVTVSQSFSKIEMLKDMIRQLLGVDLNELAGKAARVEDLANYLVEKLKDKRYFIVLDDLWTIGAWNWITSIAFPRNNTKASRIVVTTRDVGLAKQITLESLIYKHKPLELLDAMELLLRKTRKRHEDLEKDDNLKSMFEKLVKKCGRLPLAILTLGGILASKEIADWGSFIDQLPSELEINPSLEAMRRVVTLSYNHLPSHLKSCFLYLSIFPEDSEIQRRRLVERWIAEGFVRARIGVTIEDVGTSYFNELIDRSMIQPSRVSIEGSVKSCRVHDIMHDVMVSIAKDENFVYLASDDVVSAPEENFHHIAYHGSKCQKVGIDCSHVRSLTIFGERPMETLPSVCSRDYKMLRTLDLADAQVTVSQNDINNIGLLCHLKYVNLRDGWDYSNIYKLPRSIKKLQGLQTLDIRESHISTLPNEISKLESLRSLRCSMKGCYTYFDVDDRKKCLMNTLCLPIAHGDDVIAELHMAYSSHWSELRGVRVPRGIGNLKQLQILETVDIKRTSSKAIEELGELVQLRKLRVETSGATEKKRKIICAALEKLSSLCSLQVEGGWREGAESLKWMHSMSSPPPLLRSLKLNGCFGEDLPIWVGSLMHLVKISLRCTELEEGKGMEILGELPNLRLLSLDWDSYVGKKLVFKDKAFPNLRKLYADELYDVQEVRFEEGTSPQLQNIKISDSAENTGTAVIGIKHLPELKEISLGQRTRVPKLAVLEQEVDTHPNNPVLRLARNRSEHTIEGSDEEVLEAMEGSSSDKSLVAESSQVVAMPTATTSDSEDDLR